MSEHQIKSSCHLDAAGKEITVIAASMAMQGKRDVPDHLAANFSDHAALTINEADRPFSHGTAVYARLAETSQPRRKIGLRVAGISINLRDGHC